MYLNIIQLAESFGVEEGVVEGWVRDDGLPCVADRARWRFDRAQVVAWAARRGLVAKAGFLAPGRPSGSPGCRIGPLLRAGGIWRNVPAAGVLDLLQAVIAKLPGATPPVHRLLAQRLQSREGISWAPVGGGLALPHLRFPVALGRDSGVAALLFLKDACPVPESVPDSEPIRRLLFFIAPSPRAHLELLGQLGTALACGTLRRLVVEAAPDEQMFAALTTAESGEEANR